MKGIFWRTLTFKKSVIYPIKVNYTSYNCTPCNSTWTCLIEHATEGHNSASRRATQTLTTMAEKITVTIEKKVMGIEFVKGGFQLLDLIITELKSHMTCYNPIPLIG